MGHEVVGKQVGENDGNSQADASRIEEPARQLPSASITLGEHAQNSTKWPQLLDMPR